MNIMNMVKGAVTDQVMGQIGGMLGMSDKKKTSSTFDTAIGSILCGMMNKSSSKEGAKQVFDMASKADTGIMDKIGDILGSGGDKLEAVQKTGGGMLDGLFGASGKTSMIQTLAKTLGLDGSIVGKLLTLAAPMLLGVIGKHTKSAGLDALGLGGLLGKQKPHLAAAMPSGLTQNLGFGNLLSGAGDLGKSGVDAASNVAGSAASTVGNATNAAADTARDAAKKSGGLLGYLASLIILGAIGYFAYPFVMKAVDGGANAVQEGMNDISEKAAGALDFGDISVLGDSGTKLQEGFCGITDGFSGLAETGDDGANALAGKITDFSGSLDGLALGELSDTAKPVATTMVGQFVETIKGLLGGQADGIKGILQGPIDVLIEKLEGLGFSS